MVQQSWWGCSLVQMEGAGKVGKVGTVGTMGTVGTLCVQVQLLE